MLQIIVKFKSVTQTIDETKLLKSKPVSKIINTYHLIAKQNV